MATEINILQGQILKNAEICEIFKCGTQGGMRLSKRTNSLVLISNHVKSIYDDRWLGEIFHYTGMGQVGDQRLSFMQNKTLAESGKNGVEVHLFEVDREQEYRYQGRVELAGQPYTETQPDKNNIDRRVIVFPLRLADRKPVPVSEQDFLKDALNNSASGEQ